MKQVVEPWTGEELGAFLDAIGGNRLGGPFEVGGVRRWVRAGATSTSSGAR
ncbi:hypothetical protein ACFW4M_04225 [Streptomyces sp. NPDC058794]|uniref:hypothetical protein n=1 Tax=unclassified Streptomyces TaxID=2593676 RepID=UPI00369B7319